MNLYEQLQETVGVIRSAHPGFSPRVGLILGSGLGAFADQLESPRALLYQDLPHFPHSSVVGHASRLVLGRLGGEPLVVMQGRVHAYEGYPQGVVAYPARTLCALGIHTLVVTNAAGGIHPDFKPGDLMAIEDHLNLSAVSALTGPNDDRLGPRFPDMSRAYSPALRDLLLETAASLGQPLRKGVYAQLPGPSYETPAEIRMLRLLGADAVGMSTVPEVVVANHMGVRVAGISCITNLAAGLGDKPLSHEEVGETAGQAREAFSRLLSHFLPLAARLPLS